MVMVMMEASASASLLVAPKPSASIRGKSRRFLVAAAAHVNKDPRGSRSQVLNLLSSKHVTTAAAMMKAAGAAFFLLVPCDVDAASALEEPLFRAVAVLGDLDPATAKTVAAVAGPALSAFGFLFILRIVMSWYPRLPVTKFPYVLAYAPTEPFLAVTRNLIPPLAGVDVTPVVWFGLVSFLNEILVGPQGLLLLISQQHL